MIFPPLSETNHNWDWIGLDSSIIFICSHFSSWWSGAMESVRARTSCCGAWPDLCACWAFHQCTRQWCWFGARGQNSVCAGKCFACMILVLCISVILLLKYCCQLNYSSFFLSFFWQEEEERLLSHKDKDKDKQKPAEKVNSSISSHEGSVAED